MNELKLFGVHATALRLRAERASVLATNLANVNTPGYKAQDMDFHEIMAGLDKGPSTMRRTSTMHISSSMDSAGSHRLKYRIPAQDSLDGNSVDMQQERSAFTQNALMYQTSLRFLNGKIQGLIAAIRGE